MSLLSKYEDALRALIADEDGDPLLAYVTYAVTTDAETGDHEIPYLITPPGQREFVTRGLLVLAGEEMVTGPTISFVYAGDDEDSEDDDDVDA
jgi:hypothetical protein